MKIKEEIWFEIFRSIHPNNEELDDEEAIKQHLEQKKFPG